MNIVAIDRIAKFSRIAERKSSGGFQYRFDELGIEVDGNLVGSFSGTARVTYHEDDGNLHWFIHEIYLDGHDGEAVEIERQHYLYIPLWGSLEETRKDSIQAAVEGQL